MAGIVRLPPRSSGNHGLSLVLTNTISHGYSPEHKSLLLIDGKGRQEINGTVKGREGDYTFGGHSTTTYRERRTFP